MIASSCACNARIFAPTVCVPSDALAWFALPKIKSPFVNEVTLASNIISPTPSLLVVPLSSSVLKFLNAIVWFLYIPNGQVSLRTAARANENGQKLFSLGRRRRRERNAIARARIRSGKAVDREVIFSARRRTLLKRENNENKIQARISREHYGEIVFTESRNKDDFETVMGVRKEGFARAKVFEL